MLGFFWNHFSFQYVIYDINPHNAESDVYRRQILTSKDVTRAEMINENLNKSYFRIAGSSSQSSQQCIGEGGAACNTIIFKQNIRLKKMSTFSHINTTHPINWLSSKHPPKQFLRLKVHCLRVYRVTFSTLRVHTRSNNIKCPRVYPIVDNKPCTKTWMAAVAWTNLGRANGAFYLGHLSQEIRDIYPMLVYCWAHTG